MADNHVQCHTARRTTRMLRKRVSDTAKMQTSWMTSSTATTNRKPYLLLTPLSPPSHNHSQAHAVMQQQTTAQPTTKTRRKKKHSRKTMCCQKNMQLTHASNTWELLNHEHGSSALYTQARLFMQQHKQNNVETKTTNALMTIDRKNTHTHNTHDR